MTEATLITNDARFSRQSAIIHPDLADAQVLVAGVGMLGSFTALALAHCVKHVAVWDMDSVEDVNMGNQAYNATHYGLPKGKALEAMCAGFPLSSEFARFPLDKAPSELLPHTLEGRKLIVVSGVDSLAVRGELANYARHHGADYFVDTRAMGDVAVILIVPPDQIERYLRDELPKDEDVPDVPCGMNGTAYIGSFVAGKVVASLNASMRGVRVPFIRVEDVNMGVVLHEAALEEEVVKKEE